MSSEEVLMRWPVKAKKLPGEIAITQLRISLQSSDPSKSVMINLGSITDVMATEPDKNNAVPPLVRITYHDAKHKEKKLTVEFAHPQDMWKHKAACADLINDLRSREAPAAQDVQMVGFAAAQKKRKDEADAGKDVKKRAEIAEQRRAERVHQARAMFLTSRPNEDKLFRAMVEEKKYMTIDEFFEPFAAELDPEAKHPVQALGSVHGVDAFLLTHVARDGAASNPLHDQAAEAERRRVLATHPGLAAKRSEVVPMECREEEFWARYVRSLYFCECEGRSTTHAVDDPLFAGLRAKYTQLNAKEVEDKTNPVMDLISDAQMKDTAGKDRSGNFMDRINQQSTDIVAAMRRNFSNFDRKRALEEEMALERPDSVFANPRPPAKNLALTDQLTGKPVKSKHPQRSASLDDAIKKRMQSGAFCDLKFDAKVASKTLHEQTTHLKWQESALHHPQIPDSDKPAIDDLMESGRVVHRTLQQFWGTTIPEPDKRTRFVSALNDQRKLLINWCKKDWSGAFPNPPKDEAGNVKKQPTSKDAISVAKYSVIDPLDKAVKVWEALGEKPRTN